MSEQRIEIVFFRMKHEDGSGFVEAEVSVDGSIEFMVSDDETLANTARSIMKRFGDRTRVWVSWGNNADYIAPDYSRIYYEREARFWDSGNGAGREAVLMSPTSRLC
jgi:hypothetical protein